MSSTEDEADVVMVGGGPCGLALAIGMRQLGYSRVVVVERCAEAVDDWSKAYSYRLDCRGLRLMQQIGLLDEIKRRGIESTGFSIVSWKPDGSMVARPGMSLGSVGYWMQRPQLIELLREKAAAEGVEMLTGQVSDVRFDEVAARAVLQVDIGALKKQQVRCSLLFGCDGMHSVVRATLEKIDPAFGTSTISSPSAGLVYRAVLCANPEGAETSKGIGIMSSSAKGSMFGVRNSPHAESLSLLPFAGDPAAPRPLGCARVADNWIFRCATADELYDKLDAIFPQLQARQRLEPASVEAWVTGSGSTFPQPRWARRAVHVACAGTAAAAILGDALHAFPPDLGQGVNAGLEDVESLLGAITLEQAGAKAEGGKPLTDEKGAPVAALRALAAWGPERAREAEAICRLLPIGFPYQYPNLPLTAQKVRFLADFLTRLTLFKLLERLRKATGMPNPLYAPVILLIQEDPPIAYSSILSAHHYNSRVLLAVGLAIVAVACALVTF